MRKQTRLYTSLFLMLFTFLLCGVTTISAQTEARKIDEYGKIRMADENARLENFVIEMKSDTAAKGYIISYGGRTSRPKDALTMANRAKAYTAKKGKIKPARLVAINGGYKEEPTTELWLVPRGAEAPMASPVLDPSEVTPPKVVRKVKAVKSKKKSVKRKA